MAEEVAPKWIRGMADVVSSYAFQLLITPYSKASKEQCEEACRDADSGDQDEADTEERAMKRTWRMTRRPDDFKASIFVSRSTGTRADKDVMRTAYCWSAQSVSRWPATRD